MSTTTLTPRQSFRDILAQAAAQAKALLPQAVNGRIESACRMVLAGDVFFKDDGSATVGSPALRRCHVSPPCAPRITTSSPGATSSSPVTSTVIMSIDTAPTIGTRCPRISTEPRPPRRASRPSA